FLLEEAYNQDKDVVQHIATFVHFRTPAVSSDFGFTQEWPLGGQRHQGSYSIPYSWAEGDHSVGDILLNYRFQVAGLEGGLAVAPRLSVILPTGPDDHHGGVQVAVPVSRRTSAHLAFHANVGATLMRGVAGPTQRETLTSFYAGASA